MSNLTELWVKEIMLSYFNNRSSKEGFHTALDHYLTFTNEEAAFDYQMAVLNSVEFIFEKYANFYCTTEQAHVALEKLCDKLSVVRQKYSDYKPLDKIFLFSVAPAFDTNPDQARVLVEDKKTIELLIRLHCLNIDLEKSCLDSYELDTLYGIYNL